MGIIGTVATAAVGLVVPGGVVRLILKFGAKALFGKALSGLKSAGGFLVAHWKPVLCIAAIGLTAIYVLNLRGELRSRDKTIASQNGLISRVKAEVDRGVGKPTDPNDAPVYIRHFVDNLATVTSALDRQSAALNAAKQDANAHDDAAHQANRVTPTQQRREQDRQAIVKGTGALTKDDWSKL